MAEPATNSSTTRTAPSPPKKRLLSASKQNSRKVSLKLPTVGTGNVTEINSDGIGSRRRNKDATMNAMVTEDTPKPSAQLTSEGPNPFHLDQDAVICSLLNEGKANGSNALENGGSPKSKRSSGLIAAASKSHKNNLRSILERETKIIDQKLKKLSLQKDAEAILISQHAKDRGLGRENLHEFVTRKREMFLLQYALGVKRDEIKKLEKISQDEEKKLLDAEKKLEEDASKFDAILKENDKNSVEAIKTAEAETRLKLEKIAEIKKHNLQIMAIRAEMSKNEDLLKDYQGYRHFLEKLTPPEWIKKHQIQKQKQNKLKHSAVDESTQKKKKSVKVKISTVRKSNEDLNPNGENADEDNILEEDAEDEIIPLYFDHPQQLLDIFAELEESNLELIQNCQEKEETLEEIRHKIQETEIKMKKEMDALKSQIDFLNAAISKEKEKATQLEDNAKFFNSSLSEADQEKLLTSLNSKVKDVYRRCLGDAETNIPTLQMLAAIENRLEQLFEQIEMMPAEKVERAERLKDKERRQRLREEKMEAQRAQQEERVQRALERARAPVKKKTGKPVFFRSAPPQKKKTHTLDTKMKDEEDMAYYWE